MDNGIITHLADLGDSGFTLALAGAMTLYLFLAGARRQAAGLAATVGLAGAGIAALKLIVFGCHPAFSPWHIASPSGHAAMAAAVYGGLALAGARQVTSSRRWMLYLPALLLIAAIAWSRLALHAHSGPEVAAGLATGGLACLAGHRVMRGAAPARLHPLGALLAVGGATLLFYGNRSGVEVWLQAVARSLGQVFGRCF